MDYFLLGFDVGTKNLAFCLSKYTKNKKSETENNIKLDLKNLSILDWGILNIHYVKLLCKQIKNKRAICNNKCYDYILKNDCDGHEDINNINGYCQTHVKNLRVKNKNIIKQQKLKERQSKLKAKNKLNNKSNISIVPDDDIDVDVDVTVNKIHKVKDNSVFADNINTTTEKLIIELEKLFLKFMLGYKYDIDTKKISRVKKLRVVIENQPTKRQSMNNIAMAIFTFFLVKKRMHPNIIGSVNFVHAKSKTKKEFITNIHDVFGVQSSINKFIEYSKRKTFAEEIIKKLIFKIKDNDEDTLMNIGAFITRKKKDDLADALLFVLYACFYHI
jgi:hypothetical protein